MRAAVHLLNARMGFVFVLSITMEMDITAHVSYKVKEKPQKRGEEGGCCLCLA